MHSAFPLLKTIAAECGYGVSTVKRALNELLEAGYIEKQARFDERKKGGQTSNLYILLIKESEPESPEHKPTQVKTDNAEDDCTEDNENIVLKGNQCAVFTYVELFGTNQKIPVSCWSGGQSIFVPP